MITRLASASLLAAALTSQQHLDLAPGESLLHVEVDGWARFSQRFGSTRPFELCMSREFRDLMAPWQEFLAERLATLWTGTGIDGQAVQQALTEYSGRVVFDLHVQAGKPDEAPAWVALLALTGDGHSDLAAWCRAVAKEAIAAGLQPVPASIAGGEWWTFGDDAVGALVLPRMIGEHAVAFAGTRLAESLLARYFPARAVERRAGDADAIPPLHLRVDLRALAELPFALGADREGSAPVLAALGISGLGVLDLRVQPLRRHVEVVFDLPTPGGRRGLLELFLPERTALPSIADSIPRSSVEFSVLPLATDRLESMVRTVLAAAPQGDLTWEELVAKVEEAAGVRLDQDLFAHLGNELFYLSPPPDAGAMAAELEADAAGAVAGVEGLCVGLALRDGAALQRTLETMLDRAGLLRVRKSDRYREHDVHRITLPVVTTKVHWVTTDRLLLVAVGDLGRKHLHAVLDETAARARGEPPAPFGRGVRERLELVPPGYCALAYRSFAEAYLAMAAAVIRFGQSEMFAGLEGIDADPAAAGPAFDAEQALATLDDLGALVRKFELSHALSVAYHGKERVLGRLIW